MKVFISTSDSRHFSFAGYGTTARESLEALRAVLVKHAAQYAVTDPADWIGEMIDGAETQEFKLGRGYRDNEEI